MAKKLFEKGRPKTGGRKRGSANVKTRAVADKCAADGELTPLEYFLRVLRNPENPTDLRMDAAKNAAPYIHPRLSAVEFKGDPDKPLIPKTIELVLVDPAHKSPDPA